MHWVPSLCGGAWVVAPRVPVGIVHQASQQHLPVLAQVLLDPHSHHLGHVVVRVAVAIESLTCDKPASGNVHLILGGVGHQCMPKALFPTCLQYDQVRRTAGLMHMGIKMVGHAATGLHPYVNEL
jgi:hypothetical protein